MGTKTSADILIIGGGPAGLAAAHAASGSGQKIALVDDNPALGGQIWRGGGGDSKWLGRFPQDKVEVIHQARVVSQPAPNELLAETPDGVAALRYRRLILATGARERFLPFPGWTLPNVTGAGGLQALVKSGYPIAGKRVVVAGSGPLLLAVAAYLKKQGARIELIAEQANFRRLIGFGLHILTSPSKLRQAIGLRGELAGIPYLTNCIPVAAHGDEVLTGVTLRRGGRQWRVECDYLACGFHLVPNLELATLLDCHISRGCVKVDEYQRTSVDSIYCAGEATGIGGLELSLAEGQIAGYAATENEKEARKVFRERERARRFAVLLDRTFALRDDLRGLPEAGTIVCRCEDVTYGRLEKYRTWRSAKLQTRCGMGACQGRICGAAVEYLFGWRHESVRPPVLPARVESLMGVGREKTISQD